MSKNQLDPRWISWAKQQVRIIRDGGYMIFPSDGAVFQINKGTNTLDLVCCQKSWLGSDTEATNRKVFREINYTYVVPENVPTTPEATIEKLTSNIQKYAADMSVLLHAIGVVFRLKDEHEANDDKLLDLMGKMGKKMPINPVTIRGRNVLNTEPGNMSIGRLWIGVDHVPDAAFRFDPSVKRGPRWDKPVTIVLWSKEHEITTVATQKQHIVVEEEDFISAVKRLKENPRLQLKVWGKLTRLGDERASIVFRRGHPTPPLYGDMLVTVYAGEENQTETANVTLEFDKFIDGLGHLFPNGELHG